jgi:hypothetical protein
VNERVLKLLAQTFQFVLQVVLTSTRNQFYVRQLTNLARLFGFRLFVLLKESRELAIVVTLCKLQRYDVLQLLLEGEEVLLQDLLVSNKLIDILQVLFNFTLGRVLKQLRRDGTYRTQIKAF